MNKILATLRPPSHQYNGNLLWNVSAIDNHRNSINTSITQLRKLDYWASEFPEGDGITFTISDKKKTSDEILADFRSCFGWLHISIDLPKIDKPAPKRSPLPSLGYEESITINKADIALTQLEDAIDLFLTNKRLSSITLAAAADGIFSGILKSQNRKSSAEETWTSIEEARTATGKNIAGDRTAQDAFNEWNFFQNRLKHHDLNDDKQLEINIFDHAYYAIKRTIADAGKLGYSAKNGHIFEKWILENIFL